MFFNGGCDSHNMLVPYDGCVANGSQADLFQQYAAVRSDVGMKKTELLPIDATRAEEKRNVSQACSRYGVHEDLATLAKLYKDGDALFFANAGPLTVPVTADEFTARSPKLPASLFAHNIQQRLSQTLATSPTEIDGVLGRMVGMLGRGGTNVGAYSISGNAATVLTPQPNNVAYDVVGSSSVATLTLAEDLIAPMINITNRKSDSPFAETWSSSFENAFVRSKKISAVLKVTELEQDFVSTTASPTNLMGRQLSQVAKLIKARSQLGNEQDVFFVTLGGFNVHSDSIALLRNTFTLVYAALSDFEQEMKLQKLWDNVTVVQSSDFARTLTSNGAGTDHAWGGNYFMAGGAVRGGHIFGEYPDDLTDNGKMSIGRGRLVPTTSWDAIWNGVGQWFGVPDNKMDEIIPNRGNFRKLFKADDIFTKM